MSLQSRIELILGHGFQDAVFIQFAGILGVESHVERLGRDYDLVDLLPRPFEVGTSGLNDPELRVVVELLLLLIETLCDRGICRHGSANAFGSSEAGLNRPLVLIHRVKARDQVPD